LITLYIGLTSEEPGRDDDREWWARVMGWTLLVAGVWTIVCALSLLSVPLMGVLRVEGRAAWAAITAATSALGLIGAKSASSGSGSWGCWEFHSSAAS